MNFTESLVAKLSEKHLLKHELYQAWNEGKAPIQTLQLYAEQYYHHVRTFPRYLSATHSNCEDILSRQFLLENLNDEERGPENHPELWLRFAEGIGTTREQVEKAELLPETEELVDTFMSLSRKSYASGLGALFAYEQQVPEIAQFKSEALKNHYDVKEESAVSFFEVHKKADVYHRQVMSNLLNQLSTEEKEIAEKSARIAADQLWKFLDGIYRRMSL